MINCGENNAQNLKSDWQVDIKSILKLEMLWDPRDDVTANVKLLSQSNLYFLELFVCWNTQFCDGLLKLDSS